MYIYLDNNAYKRNSYLFIMNKTLVLGAVVILVLILGLGLIAGSYIYSDNENNAVSDPLYNVYYESDINNVNGNINSGNLNANMCGYGGSEYPCFTYPDVEQVRGEGHLDIPEQEIKYPCQTPKPRCPLCKEPLEQVRGDGHLDIPEQVRVNC